MEKLHERKREQLERSMKESSMKQDEERMKNEKRKLILEKNYEMEEDKKEKLIMIQTEKSKRSEMAKHLNEKKLLEKKFREFVTGQDKQFNVQRIARQYEYKLEHLDDRIQGDNMRAERIRRERDEIMSTKQKLRRDIDKDKQAILQDFEHIKQGKVDPSIIAKKYGYVGKPPGEGEGHGMSQTGGMSQSKLRNSTGHSHQQLPNRSTRTAEPGQR